MGNYLLCCDDLTAQVNSAEGLDIQDKMLFNHNLGLSCFVPATEC